MDRCSSKKNCYLNVSFEREEENLYIFLMNFKAGFRCLFLWGCHFRVCKDLSHQNNSFIIVFNNVCVIWIRMNGIIVLQRVIWFVSVIMMSKCLFVIGRSWKMWQYDGYWQSLVVYLNCHLRAVDKLYITRQHI